jgi:two-component system cell cycle response regulator
MRKVLVADDSPLVRRLLKTLLERSTTCDVLEAEDGAAALHRARTERPHVIVLDLEMPELNGLAVCTMLKGDPSTRGVPVLILTGTAGDDVQGYAWAAGADGFFAKPLGTCALCRRVVELLDRGLGGAAPAPQRLAAYRGPPAAPPPRERADARGRQT